MCLSHPCRLARRVHEDSLCEATSELTVSDSMFGLTSRMFMARRTITRVAAERRAWLEGHQRTRGRTAQVVTVNVPTP